LSAILFLIAVLIILIPTCIVLATEITFSSSFSQIALCISLALFILGKILIVIKKDKGEKSILGDIGVIVGLIIVFVSTILK
jgi:hypothetical protein